MAKAKIDYINDIFLKLTKEGRIRDAVDFCEIMADRAPCVEFRCIALKNLAECHFFMTGDGEACREANLRGLRLMEENPELLEGTEHMARDLVRRLYFDFCEQLRSVALSIEEYGDYCRKPLRLREMNDAEKRGLKVAEDMRDRNIGWKENLFNMMDSYYPKSQWGSDAPGAAQASCLAQLILLNRRKLRTEQMDVNYAAQQYMNVTQSVVNNLFTSALANGFPPDFAQISFVYDRAAELLETLRRDRQADQPTVETCLEKLAGAKARMEQLCFEYVSNGSADRAAESPAYLTLAVVRRDLPTILEELSRVRISKVDVTPEKKRRKPLDPRLKKILGWLLFAVILVLFSIVVWQLNLYSFTH